MKHKSSAGYTGKRFFDLFVVLVSGIVTLPAILMGAGVMALRKEFPIFYISERMKSVDEPFDLVKFRTMESLPESEADSGVSGGHKASRITKTGHFLRGKRLDEVPQLYNVLRNEISLVGPRPPLHSYTARFPEIYCEVLKSKPGITGLASLVFHRTEERLLAQANSTEETDQIYSTRCIPRKAKIDLIYQKRASVSTDLYVLYLTAAKLMPLPGRRARRVRGR
ncbi:sugar transferase [Octadecabacter sp. G9-8]|uniref:Sugar transferase n=1 Tax=Octadecabacter dasysiphoniae TaxID=2909341 RepID=A0ABS9CQW1_9RHOB|nr:sugar transferase [Octadecabacter dasysiphoniae]MCF2869462.1 sugar transferase [Octadecabacter dasysiphoniae]